MLELSSCNSVISRLTWALQKQTVRFHLPCQRNVYAGISKHFIHSRAFSLKLFLRFQILTRNAWEFALVPMWRAAEEPTSHASPTGRRIPMTTLQYRLYLSKYQAYLIIYNAGGLLP